MIIRQATFADAAAIAKVRVDTWRTAYRDIIPEDYLSGENKSIRVERSYNRRSCLRLAKYPRSSRGTTSMRRLSFFTYMVMLTLLLVACTKTNPSSNSAPIDTPTTPSQVAPSAAITGTGAYREYPLPQTDSGMMRPAIDHEGRIWFGEMGHNYLAVFDPRTQQFRQMTPPRGQNGVMGLVVAPDDTIWFAEQYANYIGHYYPATGKYQVYALPTLTVPDPGNPGQTLTLPSAPNDIALDAHGNLWFTELNADALGKLDPHTGHIQQFPISSDKSVQKLNPYGVAIDPRGMVWFTEASNNHIGHLDPTTGKISFFTMSGPVNTLMEIASDSHGAIWITSFSGGLLLKLNPQTGTFTPYYAPHSGNVGGGIYSLAIGHAGQVWVTLSAENEIARLDTTTNHFVLYHIPTSGSLPLGVVMAANDTLWFTEAGKDKIGMLKP
jgi:virginiamycin B lyase